MLVIVVPLVFALLCLIGLQRGLDWRQALVGSALVSGVWVAVLTEVLSLFHGLNTAVVAILWWGLAVGAAAYYWRHEPIVFKLSRPQFSAALWAMLLGVVLITVGTGLTAVLAPPNNWDSMTYHMSRVMHWVQNASAAFYTTNISRQLYQPPLAEWFITQFQLLTGGDYLANLVQWLSWIGCLVTTSLTARELGANIRGQIFSVVVAGTINMGVLQSSSTQNDVVVGFWISCAVYLCLLGIRQGFGWPGIVGLGSAIGLSVLTKGTAYVYIAPFVLWVLVYAWRKQRRDILKYGLALVVMGLALNVGQYSRNWLAFGSPLGGDASLYANQAMSPALLISVMTRNLALHVAVPSVVDSVLHVSGTVNRVVQGIHNKLGLTVNDPRVTWPGTSFQADVLYFHEDSTAAPAHLGLAVLALLILTVRIRTIRSFTPGVYGLAVLTAFVLFCLTLRWQPWHSRLHLPWFLLLAPFTAIILERFLHRYFVFVIAGFLLCFAVIPTLNNQSRPLLGSTSIIRNDRWHVMFYNRPTLEASYASAIEQVSQLKCQSVGLKLGFDTWEYPLWVRGAQLQQPMRFTHVESTLGMPPEFETCAVIVSKDTPTTKSLDSTLTVGQHPYQLTWQDDHLGVYQTGS